MGCGDRPICTVGHVFTQKEMKRLFNAAGLKIAVRWVIDYERGERRTGTYVRDDIRKLAEELLIWAVNQRWATRIRLKGICATPGVARW